MDLVSKSEVIEMFVCHIEHLLFTLGFHLKATPRTPAPIGWHANY
jgi:hypothetical protein